MKTGLELLRQPFDTKHIGKLPKPTAAQTKAIKDNFKDGIRCNICGGWHHPKVVHLDYVGHAALTDRLLDADPNWYWEPIAFDEQGLPSFDVSGGLWIRLFVHDEDKVVNRLGYGHAAASNFKEIGSREKEVIGDALRNAAMRFGAALDLWHKGDLHEEETPQKEPAPVKPKQPKQPKTIPTALKAQLHELMSHVSKQQTIGSLKSIMAEYKGVTDEIKKNFPSVLQDDGDNLGFTSVYIKKSAELKANSEKLEQPEEDLTNPFM